MKIYKANKNLFKIVSKDDLLIYSELYDGYILSKDDDVETTKDYNEEYVIDTETVENNKDWFTEIKLNQTTSAPKMRTKEEIQTRMDAVKTTIESLEAAITAMGSDEIDVVMEVVASLRKEYWVLEWVINE